MLITFNFISVQNSVERSIKGYLKIEETLYNIAKTKWPLPSMPDITNFEFILNITSAIRVKEGKSCLSDMVTIASVSQVLINTGSVEGKINRTSFDVSNPATANFTTLKSTYSPHEMSAGLTIPVQIGTYFWNVKTELSLSDVRRWVTGAENLTETVRNYTMFTVTAPPEEVIVKPRSKVNVTTLVRVSIEPIVKKVDFRIDNFVYFHCDTESGVYVSFINLARFENEINSIDFINDDAKIECKDSECILKDVPVILGETAFHFGIVLGNQEPIDVLSKLTSTAKHNFLPSDAAGKWILTDY